MTTVEVLKAARARIENGWVQGTRAVLAHKNNHCCLTATVGFGGTCAQRDAESLVRQAVGAVNNTALMRWNDAKERTQAEVLAAFDKAIALAEKETA